MSKMILQATYIARDPFLIQLPTLRGRFPYLPTSPEIFEHSGILKTVVPQMPIKQIPKDASKIPCFYHHPLHKSTLPYPSYLINVLVPPF
jgi:hypothetical protein